MKAAIIKRYGSADSLRIQDMPRPSLSDDEVLVRVRATSINPVDWKIREGSLKFLTGKDFPKVLGSDFSGEIVEAGANTNGYEPGQLVYGMNNAVKGGAYAEYLAVKISKLAPKPTSLSHEEAAAVPMAALTALQGLKKGGLRAGQHILVNGASGGVGSFAVQIARAYHASVTGVCSSRHVEMVQQLGADRVVNYEEESPLPNTPTYDLIFDAHGTMSFSKARKALREGGQFVSTLPSVDKVFWSVASKVMGDQGSHIIQVKVNPTDLSELRTLIDDGQIKPFIDSVFPLEDIDEAHRKSEEGHASGKIVVSLYAEDTGKK
ncbi:NAD(P)-dependent alcohol dehydrogenase [Cesiribacter sp. SM1]|uniref:NAD(P)-dependent alcohol dehydrogenase n=1 Tax=Cesiribacter sp. SM1 TaxID=2861196 RepID=UPI001CD81135|nr:NAD(P)-dependent alcohol dehydrogenase [Cesiribacter sp. SM1]